MRTLNIIETTNPQNNERMRFEWAEGDHDVEILVWKDGEWKNAGHYAMATFKAGMKKMEAMGWPIEQWKGKRHDDLYHPSPNP